MSSQQCNDCGQVFTRLDSLKRHQRSACKMGGINTKSDLQIVMKPKYPDFAQVPRPREMAVSPLISV